MPSLQCVLLAAGEASRYGSPKQLVKIPRIGKSLLEYALSELPEDLPVTLVLGAHSEAVKNELVNIRRAGLTIVENENWAQGMGSSIRAGVGALGGHEVGGVLIAVVDQIVLTRACYSQLIRSWLLHPREVTCAYYANTRGVPAIFPSSQFHLLETLTPREGAKKILQKAERCVEVELPNAEYDIDTPADLERWMSRPS